MSNKDILIPEGWTYFAHRTNTERWEEDPFDKNSIHLSKLMSVVTERDIYYEIKDYGRNGLQAYSSGTGTPFEIRCLICKLPYLNTLNNSNAMKNIMLNEFYFDRKNYGGAGGQRHHSIPKGEELVVLGIGNYDEAYENEKKIIWTIPKRFMDFYKNELLMKNGRKISMESPNNKQIESNGDVTISRTEVNAKGQIARETGVIEGLVGKKEGYVEKDFEVEQAKAEAEENQKKLDRLKKSAIQSTTQHVKIGEIKREADIIMDLEMVRMEQHIKNDSKIEEAIAEAEENQRRMDEKRKRDKRDRADSGERLL